MSPDFLETFPYVPRVARPPPHPRGPPAHVPLSRTTSPKMTFFRGRLRRASYFLASETLSLWFLITLYKVRPTDYDQRSNLVFKTVLFLNFGMVVDDNYVSFQNAVGFDRSPERLLNSVVSISHHHSNRDPNISADKPPRFSVVIQHCANDCRHPSVQRIGSPFSPEMESGGSRVSRLRAFAGH